MRIPFNRPHLTGREVEFFQEVLDLGHLSGNGPFTKRCQRFFEERFGFRKTYLTASCTDALEMCAILAGVGPGDEVIMPSYTFVSTANAFALRQADIRFVDSQSGHPNLDVDQVKAVITPRTKAIVAVHYAGMACPMDQLRNLADQHGLLLIEDAAQAIDCQFQGRLLGTWGDLATLSFHETKNIQCGQGGLCIVNNETFLERADYVWEKGTNRANFLKGKVDKYQWVDLGSSFLPGEAVAALLWAQLQELDSILARRRHLWQLYQHHLGGRLERVALPRVPAGAHHNGHLFYLVFGSEQDRNAFLEHSRRDDYLAVTHYVSLHQSPYFRDRHDGRELPNADRYTACLVRLPLYYALSEAEVEEIATSVLTFCDDHLNPDDP